jgi:hypothetical protein
VLKNRFLCVINGSKSEIKMSHELINHTLPAVIQEIEDVLYEYPKHPYQTAFSLPEMHQKLVIHVLNHVPSRYASEEAQAFGKSKVHRSSPLQERLRLEMVVRGSILHVLRENADWLSRHLPEI